MKNTIPWLARRSIYAESSHEGHVIVTLTYSLFVLFSGRRKIRHFSWYAWHAGGLLNSRLTSMLCRLMVEGDVHQLLVESPHVNHWHLLNVEIETHPDRLSHALRTFRSRYFVWRILVEETTDSPSWISWLINPSDRTNSLISVSGWWGQIRYSLRHNDRLQTSSKFTESNYLNEYLSFQLILFWLISLVVWMEDHWRWSSVRSTPNIQFYHMLKVSSTMLSPLVAWWRWWDAYSQTCSETHERVVSLIQTCRAGD